MDPGADDFKDLGAVTFDGQPAEQWQWKDKIFHIITMSTTNFFAATDKTGTYSPLAQVQAIAPFGRQLGACPQTSLCVEGGILHLHSLPVRQVCPI